MNPLLQLALSGALFTANPQVEVPPGHPPVQPGSTAPSAEELIKQLDATPGVKDGDKPFEIAVTLGNLYVSNARYEDAIAFFRQAEAKAGPMRTYFLETRAKVKGPLPAAKDCPAAEAIDQSLAALKASKGAPAALAACALSALSPLLEATVRRANAHVLLGDMQSADAAYASALELSPKVGEALYGRAALLIDSAGNDVAKLKEAKMLLERFNAELPFHPRRGVVQKLLVACDEAISAGGMTKRAAIKAQDRQVRLAQGLPSGVVRPSAGGAGQGGSAQASAGQQPGSAGQPLAQGGQAAKPGSGEMVLTKEMVEAVQNTERTPELEAGLAKLVEEGEEHLARGRFDEALGAYRRVMPYHPDNSRTKAGMAWALVKLDRQPMADRVWSVATADAAAVEALGDRLKAKGDAAGAKALWQKLAATRPDHAPALASKLK